MAQSNILIYLISNIIAIYKMILVFWMILKSLVQFNIVNQNNELIQKSNYYLDKLIEPVLQKIRGFIPSRFAQLDLSSLILFLIIGLMQSIIGKL